MDRVRVGIIGVGQIGKRHIEEYQAMPEVEIVAIAGRDEGKTRQVGLDYQIPNTYTDFRSLLAREDIDGVDICLHNNLHAPAALAAFASEKHVFCEKPIAGSYADGSNMLQAAKKAGKMLSVQLSSLFRNETKAAKTLIDRGLLGRIYHARSVGYRRRGRPYVDGYGTAQFVQKASSGGGAVFDTGVYNLGLVLHLVGNPEVLTVSGKTYQEIPMDETRRQASSYDVEELGVGFIRLQNNLSLDFFEAWAANIETMTGSMILGSHGGICLEPFSFTFPAGDLDLSATPDMKTYDFLLHNTHANAQAYDSPQKHWIAALLGQVELLPIAEITLNAMLISEGIYLSQEHGREVTAEEIKSNSQLKSTSV